jgi:GAF domain-containing protein
MKDALATQIAQLGDHPAIVEVLEEVCAITQMGFAAVAFVSEDRWIAAQVLDRIEFGLNPGSELDIKTTICNEIRQSGQRVIIDRVFDNPEWSTHPVPILYGFQSYASLPIFLEDGAVFGTLCAIDPAPRRLTAPATLEALEACAVRMMGLLKERGVRTAGDVGREDAGVRVH